MTDDPREQLLTREKAAAAAHVGVRTIDKWVERGLLAKAADGPLYRELDVLRVEARTRRSSRLRMLLAKALTLSHAVQVQESAQDTPQSPANEPG